ncbi:MAG: hypothetical protein FWG94_12855 [Oscillospiraceae bacterium]|nr:hypothetical protein [Oscillospiraceae bacterium]
MTRRYKKRSGVTCCLKNCFYKISDRIPPRLKQTKVTFALLAGIILPLVALICSIAFISEEDE